MSSQLKNILLVTPGFPSDESDSTCITALQDFVLGINHFHPQLKVTIVSLHYPNYNKNYFWHGNQVHAIGAGNCWFPKRLLYWYRLRTKINLLIEKDDYDLIHSFWYDEVTFIISKMNLSIPHYCSFMGQDALGKNSYAMKIQLPKENLIALSSLQQKNIQKFLNVSIDHIIPWGIHKDDNDSIKKTIDIINVGSFNDVKNQVEAVNIIAQVIKNTSTLRCLFIGDGPNRKKVENLVDTMGLNNYISFLGELPRSKTMMLMAQSKLILHSSNYESFGMIFPEAIVSNTMIVSKSVGMAEPRPYWRIFQDENQAVRQILDLLENPILPTKEEVSSYSVKHTVDEYLKVWGQKKAARETLRPSNQ